MELARYGVRVNSIHPGMIDTDMMTDVTGAAPTPRTVRPLDTAAAPSHEVAHLALFLASDDSAATGSEYIVDGGMTATWSVHGRDAGTTGSSVQQRRRRAHGA
jgi:3alpha(or 20beta)-hydroxysteroid dehydrogenase